MTADALSQKRVQLSSMMVKEQELIDTFRYMNLMVDLSNDHIRCSKLIITDDFLKMTKDKELVYFGLKHIIDMLAANKPRILSWGLLVSLDS